MRVSVLLAVLTLLLAVPYLSVEKRPASGVSAAAIHIDREDKSQQTRRPAICGAPLTLHAGVIDPQFSLSAAQVESLIAAAAKEWQDATGRQWFAVSTSATGIPVNFLYDGRQSDIDADGKERLELEARLAEAKRTTPMPHDTIVALLDNLAKYREKQQTLLTPVPWAQYVNIAGSESIDVFAFSDASQLHATLLHELGHALGLDHLPQPQAIMHALRRVAWSDVHLTQYDIEAALSLCGRR